MKQHITLDQIKALSSEGKAKYIALKDEFEWFDSEMIWMNDNVYFLSIGQMIEVLEANGFMYRAYPVKSLCNDTWNDLKNKVLEV